MRIAFSICNIGFGHATRSLSIIKELEKHGHEIFILMGEPYHKFFIQRGYETFVFSKRITYLPEFGSNLRSNIKFVFLNFSKFFPYFRNVRHFIKHINPDILVSDSEIASMTIQNIKKAVVTHQIGLMTERKTSFDKVWKKLLLSSDRVIFPDILEQEVPFYLDNVEKVGPLVQEVKEPRYKIKRELGIKNKTVLVLPSFAVDSFSINHDKFLGSDYNFVFVGSHGKNRKNIRFTGKIEPEEVLRYTISSDIVIASGYTTIMEAVYYNKPLYIIPTQTEQRVVARLGEKNGILKYGELSSSEIFNFLSDKKLQKKMIKSQQRYHHNGAKESAKIIESI